MPNLALRFHSIYQLISLLPPRHFAAHAAVLRCSVDDISSQIVFRQLYRRRFVFLRGSPDISRLSSSAFY